MEHEIKRALDGKGKKHKLHTHEITYKRSANGGYHATVHRHHGAGPHSEGLSHTEDHILPDMESAQGHLAQHMGDHPEFGEMESPEEAQSEPEGGEAAEMPQAAGA